MYHNLVFTNLHELKESNAGFYGVCLIFWRTWLQRLDYIIFPFWRAFWRCSSSTLKILSVKITPKFQKNYWPQTKCYFYGNYPKVQCLTLFSWWWSNILQLWSICTDVQQMYFIYIPWVYFKKLNLCYTNLVIVVNKRQTRKMSIISIWSKTNI